MSRQYSTNDTEISDIGYDTKEMLLSNNKLRTEINLLKKEFSEKEHYNNLMMKHMEIENDKLRGSLKIMEELVNSLKKNRSNSIGINRQNKDNDSKKVILDLEQKLSNHQNTIFHLKQSELDLIRQINAFKREISDLNLNYDKLKMGYNKKLSNNSYVNLSVNCDIDLEKLDEDKKNIIKKLLKEFEETKNENQEIKENAIVSLTEKEMINMELREQIEELNNNFNTEISKYLEQILNYRLKLNDFETNQYYFKGSEASLNKEETDELIKKYAKLEEDYINLKQEIDEKEYEHEIEKMKNQTENERLIYNYKSTIVNLEHEIARYQQELQSVKINKTVPEEEQENKCKNLIVATNHEKFHYKINELDESKDKIEQKYKDQIINLKMQNTEIERQNVILKNNNLEAEKELIEYKLSSSNKLKDEKEKFHFEIIAKDRENYFLKEKVETLEKDNSNFKQNTDITRKNYEKLKIEYNLIYENMKKIRELHQNEIKKQEEKFYLLERKYEKQLLINNTFCDVSRLNTQSIHNLGHIIPQKKHSSNVSMKLSQKNAVKYLNDHLESTDDSPSESQVIFLQNEVILLKDQITELNLKIYKYQNIKEDNDFLLKENKKIKSDIKEMEVLYKNQIAELNRKALVMNVEHENLNKKLNLNKQESISNKNKQNDNCQFTTEKIEIIRYKAEIKFLQEKIEILNKEMMNSKILYEKDTNFIKANLKTHESTTVNAKISLATLAFEKDCEIIKYKNCVKKLKLKIKEMTNNNYFSNDTSLGTNLFKKIFK